MKSTWNKHRQQVWVLDHTVHVTWTFEYDLTMFGEHLILVFFKNISESTEKTANLSFCKECPDNVGRCIPDVRSLMSLTEGLWDEGGTAGAWLPTHLQGMPGQRGQFQQGGDAGTLQDRQQMMPVGQTSQPARPHVARSGENVTMENLGGWHGHPGKHRLPLLKTTCWSAAPARLRSRERQEVGKMGKLGTLNADPAIACSLRPVVSQGLE